MRRATLKAIAILGGQSAAARHFGVTPPAVRKWMLYRVPAERVLALEEATGGAVTRHELRPDLYPR